MRENAADVEEIEPGDARAQLRAVPPRVLYGLAAARAEAGGDWRTRGAALLLESAADDQVARG